jgi:hypothetical protein
LLWAVRCSSLYDWSASSYILLMVLVVLWDCDAVQRVRHNDIYSNLGKLGWCIVFVYALFRRLGAVPLGHCMGGREFCVCIFVP